MSKKSNALSCKRVTFHSSHDEDTFFEWIKKIDCIENVSGVGDVLYLHLSSDKIFKSDLDDLSALFYRYDIDTKQLHPFSQGKKELKAHSRINVYPAI